MLTAESTQENDHSIYHHRLRHPGNLCHREGTHHLAEGESSQLNLAFSQVTETAIYAVFILICLRIFRERSEVGSVWEKVKSLQETTSLHQTFPAHHFLLCFYQLVL